MKKFLQSELGFVFCIAVAAIAAAVVGCGPLAAPPSTKCEPPSTRVEPPAIIELPEPQAAEQTAVFPRIDERVAVDHDNHVVYHTGYTPDPQASARYLQTLPQAEFR